MANVAERYVRDLILVELPGIDNPARARTFLQAAAVLEFYDVYRMAEDGVNFYERLQQAEMLRWMFFEQYNHEPNIATLRFWLRFVGEANLSEQQRSQLMAKRIAGCDALSIMDQQLSSQDYIAGMQATLADIALFAYTHVAEEGGFGLGDYSHIQSWIERVERLPGFIPMES
ncbi:MAG: glutathione binding-like protein [Pseudomonadota bacterium]